MSNVIELKNRVSGEKPKKSNEFVTLSYLNEFIDDMEILDSDQQLPLDPSVTGYLPGDLSFGVNQLNFKLFFTGVSTAPPEVRFWIDNADQNSDINTVDLLTAKIYKPTSYDVGAFVVYKDNLKEINFKSFTADTSGIIVVELDYLITTITKTDFKLYMNCIHTEAIMKANSYVKIKRNI